MFMFLIGVGCTLGAQYIKRRFKAQLLGLVNRAEKKVEDVLKD